jgi:hypothetical protein
MHSSSSFERRWIGSERSLDLDDGIHSLGSLSFFLSFSSLPASTMLRLLPVLAVCPLLASAFTYTCVPSFLILSASFPSPPLDPLCPRSSSSLKPSAAYLTAPAAEHTLKIIPPVVSTPSRAVVVSQQSINIFPHPRLLLPPHNA